MNWQPIETAPHNEQVLLAWYRTWPSREWEYEVGFASWGSTPGTRGRHGQAEYWCPITQPEECTTDWPDAIESDGADGLGFLL